MMHGTTNLKFSNVCRTEGEGSKSPKLRKQLLP